MEKEMNIEEQQVQMATLGPALKKAKYSQTFAGDDIKTIIKALTYYSEHGTRKDGKPICQDDREFCEDLASEFERLLSKMK